jgi:hypothetical protein
MIRCTECGRFHPANDAGYRLSSWLRKLASVSMVFWVLTLISTAIGLGATQAAISYLPLDVFTRCNQVTTIKNQVTTTNYERQLRPGVWGDIKRRHQTYAVTGSMSLGLGFLATLIAIAVLPHWRWYHHLMFTVIWGILAGGITAFIWWEEAPQLFRWGLERIADQTWVYILGGLMAALVGRHLIKLAARICLTPRMRRVIETAWSRLETGQDRA